MCRQQKRSVSKMHHQNCHSQRPSSLLSRTMKNIFRSCSSSSSAVVMFLVLVLTITSNLGMTKAQQLEIPCPEFHPRLTIPCLCGLNEINATRINCDKSVFAEFPVLPYRFYIQEFSQRNSGLQTLGAQLFTASDLPQTRVDFSHNSLKR